MIIAVSVWAMQVYSAMITSAAASERGAGGRSHLADTFLAPKYMIRVGSRSDITVTRVRTKRKISARVINTGRHNGQYFS
jgi:hypothetical protein